MNWILDIVLFLIFTLTVIIYTVRGFAASIWGVVRSVGSIMLSFFLGKAIGESWFKNWLSEKFEKEELVKLMTNLLGYIVVFIIAFIVFTIVGILVKKAAKTAILKDLNRFIGTIFGIISGIIYLWVICWILSFVVEQNLAGEVTEQLQELVKTSYIFTFFCKISPFEYFEISKYIDEIKAKFAEATGFVEKIKTFFAK